MANVYSNENVPLGLVEELRSLGHDVLTSYEAGRANQRVNDDLVLADAQRWNRVILTHNRRDFVGRHRKGKPHCGIVVCTEDPNHAGLASRIDTSLRDPRAIGRYCVSVTKGGHKFL